MGNRPGARTRGIAWLLAAGAAAALWLPTAASAAIRFAAPGGTAPDTVCLSDTGPACSIGTAAGGPDVTAADQAVILPGRYSDADLNGDTDQPMDHTVHITAGSVHGEPGERPVIALTSDLFSAFLVDSGTTLSDVEVDAPNSSGVISIAGGVVERVIARTSRDGSTPCDVDASSVALLRDSLCFTDGGDSSAVRAAFFSGPGTHTIRLRNVTALAPSPDSDGLFFEARAMGTNLNVDAKSVIARGGGKDVFAAGLSNFDPPLPNTGASTSVSLDHSNYVTTEAQTDIGGGTATITPAGSGTNQTGAVVLAPDAYHQVAGSGSLILDHGAVDAFSGTTDIDGQARTIGGAPDIGADELAFPTRTSLSCTPNPLVFGSGATRCTVEVTDTTSTPPVSFHSGVRFASDRPGEFGGECEVLAMTSPTEGSCTQPFTPAAPGLHHIVATFPGDVTHDGSSATDVVNVTSPMGLASQIGRRAKCKRKHKHSAAAAKKKCKRKKRR